MENVNVNAEKSFPVEVSELYKAWTEEAALKQWWKPAGRKLQSVESAQEKGGTIKYTFEPDANSNGDLVIEGSYEEVIPDKKLVYTWNWKLDNAPVEKGEYKLTVEFSGDGQESKLAISQETDGEQEGIHPNKEGWDDALNDLEAYLSQAKDS